MTTNLTRRTFIETGTWAGACLALCPLRLAGGETDGQARAEPPAFDERVGYCCAECTKEKCPWLGDDPEFKKKKAAELSQRLGREIKPEQITCSRCRVGDAQASQAIKGCRIRQCVIEKKLLTCAHCRELKACERANRLTRERALAIQRAVLGEVG